MDLQSWDFVMFNMLLDRLTPSLREKFEAEHRKIEIPTYKHLATFLSEYCKVLASVSSTRATTINSPSKASTSSFATKLDACPVCKEQHTVYKCSTFLKLSPQERHSKAKELNLCLSCLRSGHGVRTCNSKWKCRSCLAQHHTLLHFESTLSSANATIDNAVSTPPQRRTDAAESSVVTMTSVSKTTSTVLLSTAQAEALDVHGNPFTIRLLLDSASQSNFISEECMRRGGYSRTRDRTVVLAINDTKAVAARGCASFALQPIGGQGLRISVQATILPRISSLLPSRQIQNKCWQHLRGLPLADPQYHRPGPVDVLIGAALFTSLLRDGRRIGENGEPSTFNTIFGWVLLGPVFTQIPQPVQSFLTVDSLDQAVHKFWQLEEVPASTTQSGDDTHCEVLFEQTTHRDNLGRFIVSYPFAEDRPCFVDSRQIAVQRFRSLERRFRLDSEFKNDYKQFMQEYLDSGHMELVSQPFPTDGRVYYLPHHGVCKLDSLTTKLRVVFDAFSRCSNGLSLNQTLRTGPKLQADIMAVLLRFRLGVVALTADVKQMFRQIWINPSQRDYQRIVWRFSEEEPISDYRLKTVTFGITPSPYLAIRCLLELAKRSKTSHPLASAVLESSLYVDDVVTSVQTVEEARELREQLQSLLSSGGFELRKWASSHPSALSGLDSELCSRSLLTFESPEEPYLKVLGLRWFSRTDAFGFHVNTSLDKECTKRIILSELARIFDPLGFLAPLTFAAKCLIQKLWQLNLDWDDEAPSDISIVWGRYRAELTALAEIRLPRSVTSNDVVKRELHAFCDASEQGYGAVIYLRMVTADKIGVHLLSAKSKVAPLKSVTLPRLELCAATLLSELLLYLKGRLSAGIAIDDTYCWSDSTVTLSWIRSSPSRWQTFVRNRIARIQSNTEVEWWRHVDTKSNPADCCSRGLSPLELVNHKLWWHGPPWLSERPILPDGYPELERLPVEEEKSTALATSVETNLIDNLINRFSSLKKIVHIVAYCLRFIKRTRGLGVSPPTTAVDQIEFHSALLTIVKWMQADCFADDLHRLTSNRTCSSALRQLAPFLDQAGVLRVGSRLSHSDIDYEAKHPALLPGRHRLTELIIERTHRVHLHPGRRALHYLLLQNFWIIGAHQAIKRCLSNCYRCFRANPRAVPPFMADLPKHRVRQAKPFAITGVDYAGPFAVSPRRARGVTPYKSYACIFVCFTTKAVHLELALSLTTDSFLAALRRFVSRRGRCSQLYSDCGTNFVGAHRELERCMHAASELEELRWSFNPPSAPHFGGLWEAGVKSVKTHLKRVIGAQILTAEEFNTLLTQIEAILNSRPLCPIGSDPSDLEVLSPGHFLTLEPLVAVPHPDLELVPISRLDRWQLVQHMHQTFWTRWHKEYLHTLQQRPKWQKPGPLLKVGDLVLIKIENAPPLNWKRGRIVELHPGSDGVPRVATMRTSDGIVKRPIVKLCSLPMDQGPLE